MLESLRLQNVGPAPELGLEFGSRLNLITGDNGLGKSFILDVAWWALTRRWPQDLNSKLTAGYMAKPTDIKRPASISFALSSKTKSVKYESKYSPRDSAWVGKAGRPWNPGLVIYAHADGGFSVWDPARNYWKKKGDIDIQDRLPGYVFSQQEVWDGLTVDIEGRPTVVCEGLIRDWSSWIREGSSNARRMEIILQKLSPSLDEKDLLQPGGLTRPFKNDVRDVPSLKMPYGNEVPIVYASSGVRRIVALSYMLMWAWKEHVVAARDLGEARAKQVTLLVDEIESHLHPRWQRAILGAVLGLASLQHAKAKIQLIAATHSPLVLASAEPLFDPSQDAWFDLDLESVDKTEKLQPVIRKREFVRHGEVSNWLTSDAFDLKSARSIEAELAIEKARAIVIERNPSIKDVEKINEELQKAALPDIDPFWVRWGAFLEGLKRND